MFVNNSTETAGSFFSAMTRPSLVSKVKTIMYVIATSYLNILVGVSIANILFFPIVLYFLLAAALISKMDSGLVYPFILILLYSPLETNPIWIIIIISYASKYLPLTLMFLSTIALIIRLRIALIALILIPV